MNGLVWSFVALLFALLALLAPSRPWQRRGFLVGSWAAALLVLIVGIHTLVTEASIAATPAALVILPGFSFALDPLRAFFLVISAGVYALAVAFVAHDSASYSPLRARLMLGFTTLLFAAMVTVLMAAGVTSLIFAWEVMSLSLAALVFVGDDSPRGVRAGLLTLALSEAGALAALAGLLLLAATADTLSLSGIAAAAAHLPDGIAWAGFLLTFFGFGVKTGLVVVNSWMKDGYVAAPRGVLPLFSGATLNLGVFTLWVVDGPLASHMVELALVVLVTGAVTALLGIVYALATHSLTRLLTHSSIENLGIVVAALGAGFAFTALGRPMLGGLTLVGGLYHMLNHSTYKTLLFLGAGGIREKASDDINRLGGIMRHVPLFGTLFLIGAFAIAALPPLNGFVSEWLVLQSLLRVVEFTSVPVRFVFAFSGALLALTAGLAVTCFAMLVASSLLGVPRSHEAAAVRSMPASVTLPMGVLAIICFGLGVLATGVIPILGRLTTTLTGVDPTAALVPAFFGHVQGLAQSVVHDLTELGAQLGHGIIPLRGLVILNSGGNPTNIAYAMSTALTFAVLAFLLLVLWLCTHGLRRRHRVTRRVLWDAGLVRLHPEMTYNATTFAAPVRVLFNRLLRPLTSENVDREGAFVTAVHRRTTMPHIVDRLTLNPIMGLTLKIAMQLARMHHGRVTLYAAYIVVTLVGVLLVAVTSLP